MGVTSLVLFHYGARQDLWKGELLQVGPGIASSFSRVADVAPTVQDLVQSLRDRLFPPWPPLLHYTDPFILRARPLKVFIHGTALGCSPVAISTTALAQLIHFQPTWRRNIMMPCCSPLTRPLWM